MRKSGIFFLYLGAGLLLVILMAVHASVRRRQDGPLLRETAGLVTRLQLSDLGLFTEANYTRHLSQADLHTAFQEGPFSLEHFPSGAIAMPPRGLKRLNGRLD